MFPTLKIRDLNVKLPIIQGGMGIGVSMSKLAAAVANEGGIGIISGAQPGYKEDNFRVDNAAANVQGLMKEIRKAKELAPNGIIGVNFLAASKNYTELVMTAVKEKADLIISGAGLPKSLPDLVKGSTTKIAPIVSSGKAAATIAKIWDRKYDFLPDAVIVEGPLAGGHLGFSPEVLKQETLPKLKDIVVEVIDALKPYEEKYGRKVAVIAAGGVYSGQDMAEMLELGASGVQMSTRFVATEECDAHENFKQAYVDANEDDIEIIVSPVGLPGRAIRNRFTELAKEGAHKVTRCYNCLKGCNPATTPYCITDALVASVEGDVENGLVFVGQNASKIKEISTVHNVIESIKEEYETYMQRNKG
jgi:NAD(P)H-dependent flavin oxidoreductase YrpB (nitropropane dioxygenase family)